MQRRSAVEEHGLVLRDLFQNIPHGLIVALDHLARGADGVADALVLLIAAKIATDSGADMVIANGSHISVIEKILNGEEYGTLFTSHHKENFNITDYLTD